jgi:phosphonopyruvate decarboxylase
VISPSAFVAAMQRCGINFATGVPDSLLKEVCAEIEVGVPVGGHQIAPNEGAAVGLAIGHFLATRSPALVYLQNSGLGNIVNPVTSLAAEAIYGIPMVLLVGWRGETEDSGKQVHDEPQHRLQGLITPAQLDLLGIPYLILDANSDPEAAIHHAVTEAVKRSQPFALLVRKSAFSRSSAQTHPGLNVELAREEAINTVLLTLPPEVAVVSTTGMASREVFETRKRLGEPHSRDFLVVGGMGHAISIAAGISHASPDRRIVCIDGDGAMMMHTGSLAVSARYPNLIHIVLNNEAHDSVGGQTSCAANLSLCTIASGFGHHHAIRVETKDALEQILLEALSSDGARFIEVACRKGNRSDLGRPDRSPRQNREDFQDFLAQTIHG